MADAPEAEQEKPMRKLTRWIALLGVLALSGAGVAVADEALVRCFLVDARIHVAVVSSGAGPEGELVWRDTVTGESGEVPFTARGDCLLLQGAGAGPAVTRLLPDLAIVMEHPPWALDRRGPFLGIALN